MKNMIIKEYIRLLLEAPVTGDTARRVTKKSTSTKTQSPIGEWIPWSKRALKIDYNKREGVGPGEDRLALELNGKVQGGNVSYDIIDDKGKKWEVKQPDNAKEIRPGTEGLAALQRAKAELEAVISQLMNGYKKAKDELNIADFLTPEEMVSIEEFLNEDALMIQKGEISKLRANNILNILKIFHNHITPPKKQQNDKRIELGDDEVNIQKNVDSRVFAKVGLMIDVPLEDLNLSDKEIFSSFFHNTAFLNPEKWFQENWVNAAKASNVFGGTDGVILVDSTKGYCIIPKEQFDSKIIFNRISQGKPRFKVQI